MNTNYNFSTPKFFIMVVKQDNSWMAIGSRKVNLFELEAKLDYYDMVGSYNTYCQKPPDLREFMINGSIQNMTMVTGNSPLSAVGALIDALREEEKTELIVEEARKHREELLKRFGGEIDEELIKKVVRWRKKQAEKKAKMREIEEYYDD